MLVTLCYIVLHSGVLFRPCCRAFTCWKARHIHSGSISRIQNQPLSCRRPRSLHRFSQLKPLDVEIDCLLMWLLQFGGDIPASAWILPHGPGLGEIQVLAVWWEGPGRGWDIITRLEQPHQQTVNLHIKGLQLQNPVEKQGSSHWHGKYCFCA